MQSAAISSEFTLAQKRVINHSSPLRWLISHTAPYWYLGLSLMLGAFGNAALAAVVPVMIGRAINAIRNDPAHPQALLPIAGIIAATQLIRGVLQLMRNFSAEMLGQVLERNIRDELYTSLLGKSMTFHSLQPVGDTMARATNDVREINLMFNPGMNLVIGSANFLIMPLFVAPGYHPALLLTPVLFMLAYILALWYYLRELDPITSGARKAFGRLNERLAEAIDGIETVKGASQERAEVARFTTNAAAYRDATIRQGDVEARFLPLLLLGLAQGGALLHASILYLNGQIDLGAVIAYFGLLQLFGFPTFVSLFAYSQVSLGIAGARRILELINRENNLDQNAGGYAAPVKGEIEFRDVTFAYPENEPSLEHISFKVKPGQTVAIVGQTGVGKTSMMKLVNRTYDVSSGTVYVDGVDVREWDLESLRRGISIIEQDIFLFSRSIADNIAFGRPDASQADIENAARSAQADEFIQTFEQGYQTVIGERGVTLSGGQRQRLALARAFLTNPGILVLDDSTSAIDSATEDRIQRAISVAARGRTTLIITHRLSQIRWADLILVLRHGRLVAQGSHEELMRTSEAYRRIFKE